MIELQVLYFHDLFSYIVDGIKQIQIQNIIPGALVDIFCCKPWSQSGLLMSSHSYRSSGNKSNLFCGMFSDGGS